MSNLAAAEAAGKEAAHCEGGGSQLLTCMPTLRACSAASEGSIATERCRRIEQAAWDRIYREGVDQLPPLERSLADWEAREADLQLTRMRLVEHFTSVSGHYISDRDDFDRFAEMLLLVEEAICWIEDKPRKGKPSLGPHRVGVQLGRALPGRPRLNQYRSNRREAMQVFMKDLEQALGGLMPTPHGKGRLTRESSD